jgi:hypothetical protein
VDEAEENRLRALAKDAIACLDAIAEWAAIHRETILIGQALQARTEARRTSVELSAAIEAAKRRRQ